MILGKYHATIDEITYNRNELIDFYNQHKHNIMNFGDYMQYLTPNKREFKGRPGMNAVAVQKTEGKDLLDYPVIKKLVDRFNFEGMIGPREIDMLHYDEGYKFHPHTDHYMNAGIMFPILPDNDITPVAFYSREGHIPERNVNYEKKYGWTDADIEYTHKWSLEHPTVFNGMAVHGVPNIVGDRVLLRIKVLNESFDDIITKLKNGTFVKEI